MPIAGCGGKDEKGSGSKDEEEVCKSLQQRLTKRKQKPKSLDCAMLTANLGEGKSWDLTLRTKSAAGAADIKKTLDDLKNLGVSLYQVQKNRIAEEMPESMRKSSIAMADKFVENLKISASAKDVVVSLTRAFRFSAVCYLFLGASPR